MNPSTISEIVAVGAAVIIGVVFMVNTGLSYRARLRASSSTAANEALKEAQIARDHATRQLAEAERLAEKFRQQREWIEANPEQFRASLRSHLNGSRP